jgi:hypothetical protein
MLVLTLMKIKLKMKLRTLEPDEIEEVKEILKEKHPLYYEGVKIHDIFPSLKPLFVNYDKDLSSKVEEVKDTDRILPQDMERSDKPKPTQEEALELEKK